MDLNPSKKHTPCVRQNIARLTAGLNIPAMFSADTAGSKAGLITRAAEKVAGSSPRLRARERTGNMVVRLNSAPDGSPGMQDEVSGLRWPAQVSASVPRSALSGSRLGRAFQGHFMRRQGASAVSRLRAEPTKRIRRITPKGTAQLRPIAAGLVEGARSGTKRELGIRLPLHAGLIPPSFFPCEGRGRSLLDFRRAASCS